MKNVLNVGIAALALVSASAAQAVTIDYVHAVAGDGSGKTSIFAGPGNTSTANVFVETFDLAGGGGGITMSPTFLTVTPLSGGAPGFAQGSLPGYYAAPAGDSTYFAYGPSAASGSSSASVMLDYAGLVNSLGPGASLNYFGLYYGSIDTYNDVTFYNAEGNVIRTVTGTELITLFGGISGNQTQDSSNIYVNLYFAPSEEFTALRFSTTMRAFEADNLVVGYQVIPTHVPEPASLALLGFGLVGLGLARRRNKR